VHLCAIFLRLPDRSHGRVGRRADGALDGTEAGRALENRAVGASQRRGRRSRDAGRAGARRFVEAALVEAVLAEEVHHWHVEGVWTRRATSRIEGLGLAGKAIGGSKLGGSVFPVCVDEVPVLSWLALIGDCGESHTLEISCLSRSIVRPRYCLIKPMVATPLALRVCTT
jgi:hypothetical protein